MAITFNHNDQVYVKDGKLGIGTASPNYKLDISGDVRIEGANFLRLGGSGAGDESWVIQQTSGNLNFAEYAVSDGRLYLQAGGNVGIGTTSPSHPLHVEGFIATNNSSNASGLLVRKAGSTIGFVGQSGGWVGDTTDDLTLSSETGKNIRFYTNGSITERMRITSDGNVGIGTTSPVTGLDVRTSPYSNTTARFGDVKLVYIINDEPIIGFNQYYDSGWKAGSSGYSAYLGMTASEW